MTGLAVLLSANAKRSFEMWCFSASARIMEPAPTILNAQSMKVTGIRAHNAAKNPVSLLMCVAARIENASTPPAFLTRAISPLKRYRNNSTCRLSSSERVFTTWSIAVSNPPMTEGFNR